MSDAAEPCRLCHGATRREFDLTVLRTHPVSYFVCMQCGSLQTEYPFWLKEAYGHNLSYLDVGAVQRNLTNACAVIAVARLSGCKDLLDFGGGDGLLCRLLRDYGLNCFVLDKYAPATYALGFTKPTFEKPDLLIAFEVIEHFADPAKEMAELFGRGADIVMVSTELYSKQRDDWWYLAPSGGQHVFFYSKKAILHVAERYRYEVRIYGRFVVLFREKRISRLLALLLSPLFTSASLRLARAMLLAGPASGVAKDFDALLKEAGTGTDR